MRFKHLGIINSHNIDRFLFEHNVGIGYFTDIEVGDYFTVNFDDEYDMHVIIAGINTYAGTRGNEMMGNHIVCISDDGVLFTSMNSALTGKGSDGMYDLNGYYGTRMFNSMMPWVTSRLYRIFGNHMIPFKEPYDEISFYTRTNLLSEAELYGRNISTFEKQIPEGINPQLPLFVNNLHLVPIKDKQWWLRTQCGEDYYTSVLPDGSLTGTPSVSSLDVRVKWVLG